MEKKRVLIVGAGVSGLATAWYLEKKKQYECVLLEKAPRTGGWMGSKEEQGFLLEEGPHLFKTSRSADLLQVVEEMDFASSIAPSSPAAQARYVWVDGAFQRMPKSPFSLLTSPFCRPLLSSLWNERKIPVYSEDETIWDFACRRFGTKVAEHFFDPLVSGIYAGNIKKLSVTSCFPILKQWEREKGSVVKGAFSTKSNKKKKSPYKSPLFSFQDGTGSFVEKWTTSLKAPVYCNEPVVSLRREKEKWIATSPNRNWEADYVVITTPSYAAGSLLEQGAPQSAKLLKSFVYEDVTTVHLGWKGDVLPFPAFGYLVPSKEKMSLLGVLFDSMMFGRKDTLITLMIRGVGYSEEALYKIMDTVRLSHLHIAQKPFLVSYAEKKRAIPQYHLGHEERKLSLYASLAKEAPNVFVTGSYLNGVSISDCISQGKRLVESCF